MAYKGIDCRATSGYVSDPANYTYSLGEASPITRGGFTGFGWSTNLTSSSRDRTTSYQPQQAGIVFVNNAGGVTRDLTVPLPDGAGTYNVKIAAGDSSAAQDTKLVLLDSGTTRATIIGHTAAGEYMDAAGNIQTSAGWNASNAAISCVFSSGTATVRVGGHSSGTLASVLSSIAFDLTAGADTTAPALNSSTTASIAQTTATIGCTTDEANGTMYAIVCTSATPPSVAQIQAGQDSASAAATYAGNQTISTTGAKTFSATGLTANTAYYHYEQHKDAAGNDSTVISSTQFTTLPNVPTAPTIGTTTGVTTSGATINWTDNSSNEVSFRVEVETPSGAGNWSLASTGASNPTAANATSLVIGSLTSGTQYRPRVRAQNTGGNSAYDTGTAFTTDAGAGASPLLTMLLQT